MEAGKQLSGEPDDFRASEGSKGQMATTASTTIEGFLAPGKRVRVNLWPGAAMAAERDRIARGAIVASDATGILLTGDERHPSQPQGVSYIPFSSIASIDEANE